MFGFFSKREKTTITIYYSDTASSNADRKMYALGDIFREKNIDHVKKFTLHPDIKTLIIELKGLIDEIIIEAFFELVKDTLDCKGYANFETKKRLNRHLLLLHD